VFLLGLPMPVAVGTSLLMIAFDSASGFAAYVGQVGIDYRTAGAFAVAALVPFSALFGV
jgi:uncharacterized protein